MDLTKSFQSFAWCKPEWCFPSMSKETNELLRQLEKLKVRRPIEKLKKNIASTYPLIHERVLLLMTHFLIYKREFGSSIEKELYKDMSVPQLIDRILKKRAITFMGQADKYLLITGEKGSLLSGLSPQEKKQVRAKRFRGSEGWESVGTVNQRPPLILENCLSYDEMKLSAMVFVSGYTECINDGERKNSGVVCEETAEPDAVIIGCIGPRFQRDFRMDYEDILITEEQNVPEHGYGEEVTPTTCLNVLKNTYIRNNTSAKHMWRQMWSEFYQVHSYTYDELTSYVDSAVHRDAQRKYTERYVRLPRAGCVFDNEVYYKRLAVLTDTVLVEADERAKEVAKMAFVNVIGCGLGVWKISKHQVDVFVLSVCSRVKQLLRRELLQHVSDVNFAYITPSDSVLVCSRVKQLLRRELLQHVSDANFAYITPSDPVLAMFTNISGSGPDAVYKVFFESKKHPRGGINVQIKRREPSSRLQGDDEGKLLVMTYPWDGNAHPGNEFWLGSLTGSGDPAAACSTQVSELHNAHINRSVSANNTRVATRQGLRNLSQYTQLQPA
ncbi:hypothetical protein B5X24_HaOG205168 [Helicoverpa armigera]|uniref:Uncharacterized protein n=1 Tax=Helicoverpa armigera TaxID=29058 RepID=A0A2W1BTJ0_HELAM|nr:hypothetical protein B5X24_HaOG205168 [Helicoverpa armigera]